MEVFVALAVMSDSRRIWLGRARRLTAKVNTLMWLDAWLVWGVGLNLAFALGVLLFRGRGETALFPIISIYALALFLLGAWRLLRLRIQGSVYPTSAALSRLEVHHGLFGQLSAAMAGHALWPDPEESESPMRFRFTPRQGYFACSFILLILSAVIPVTVERPHIVAANVEMPPDLATVETWIEVLKDDPSIEPYGLEEFEMQLASLQEEDSATWYDQASLEASSALRDNLEHSLNELLEKLEQARMAIASDSEQVEGAEVPTRLGNEALSALSALPDGVMPWRDAILKQFANEEGQRPMSLSSEQAQSLQNSMSRTKKYGSNPIKSWDIAAFV